MQAVVLFFISLKEIGFDMGLIFSLVGCGILYVLITDKIEDLKNKKKDLLNFLLILSLLFGYIAPFFIYLFFPQSPQDELLKQYLEQEVVSNFVWAFLIICVICQVGATIGIMHNHKLSRNIYTIIFFLNILGSYFMEGVYYGIDIFYDLSIISSGIAIYIMHTDCDKYFIDKS